ncbi:MAG: hypothetical protein IJ617_02855 [Oscillospiraceae bacterium]|nr:hypothetical protein [Oscillospiraceae bacterium]
MRKVMTTGSAGGHDWNLDVLDKLIPDGFKRKTPKGNSLFQEKSFDV